MQRPGLAIPQLTFYFSSKLSCAPSLDNPPPLEDCHHSIFRQFQIKKSQVKSVLQSLDVTKSVGDDKISPRILKSCAQSQCGSRTDPTCYRPIAVLPTLSRVFERLFLPQLSRRIHPHIPKEQFGFMKGSSTSDAGVLLALLLQQLTRELRQDWQPWILRGHLIVYGGEDYLLIGFCDKVISLYSSNRFIRVVTPLESSDLHPLLLEFLKGLFGLPYYSIYIFVCFQLWLCMLCGRGQDQLPHRRL